MLTVGAQISITSGWEMSLQQVGHLHAGPILTKVAAVLATRLCGATLIEQTPGSIDFVTPGIVTIDASAVQVAAGVHSNSAGVT